jgi:hypothetical protein
MKNLSKSILSDGRIPNRQLAEGLRHTLTNNYGRILGTAAQQWDRKFAGKDPSDGCVSVRISGHQRAAIDRFQTARQQYASLAA